MKVFRRRELVGNNVAAGYVTWDPTMLGRGLYVYEVLRMMHGPKVCVFSSSSIFFGEGGWGIEEQVWCMCSALHHVQNNLCNRHKRKLKWHV